jgi:hypothetical protein
MNVPRSMFLSTKERNTTSVHRAARKLSMKIPTNMSIASNNGNVDVEMSISGRQQGTEKPLLISG